MSKNNILKKLSPLHIVAFICAAVILVTVVVSAIFFGISVSEKNNKEFNYMKEDLTKYIALGDYTNLTVSPEYSKIRDVDIKDGILDLVAGEKNYSSGEDAYYDESTVINVGDVVNLYYRGYVLEEDGTPKYLDSMSNLIGSTYSTMKAYSLSIGGDTFVSGFSLALDGATVGQYPKMETTRGDVEVTDSMIAFVTYTRYPITTNKYSHVETQGSVETKTSVLVDLTLGQEKIDATYGAGFYNYLVGKAEDTETEAVDAISAAKANGENVISNTTVGFRTTADGVDYKYTKIAVEYTMAANYYENYQPIVVEFPASYGTKDLAGKTAYFQIIIESVKEYSFDGLDKDAVTLKNVDTDDAVKAIINPLLKNALKENDEFAEYLTENGIVVPEENDTTDYYTNYVNYLKHKYDEANGLKNELALYQAIIDALVESTTVVADHPELEAKYNASLITFRKAYAENGKNYATIEEYAEEAIGGDHYVTVGEGEDAVTVFDWKAAVKQLSVDYFTERMAIYQIIKTNGLYTEEAYKAAYESIYNDYAEEYKKSYCNSNGIDIDNMTVQEEQAVDAAVKNYIASNVGYEYLSDRAYYQLVFDFLADKITIEE